MPTPCMSRMVLGGTIICHCEVTSSRIIHSSPGCVNLATSSKYISEQKRQLWIHLDDSMLVRVSLGKQAPWIEHPVHRKRIAELRGAHQGFEDRQSGHISELAQAEGQSIHLRIR
jgi:hypothetical protein